MGLLAKHHTTYRVVCDINAGCGGAHGPEAVSAAEAYELAGDEGFSRTWNSNAMNNTWACPSCDASLERENPEAP
mgnify:FL=1